MKNLMQAFVMMIVLGISLLARAESYAGLHCKGKGFDFSYDTGNVKPHRCLPGRPSSYDLESSIIKINGSDVKAKIKMTWLDGQIARAMVRLLDDAGQPSGHAILLRARVSQHKTNDYKYLGTAKLLNHDDDSDESTTERIIPVRCDWIFIPSNMAG
jgi:hypothetical protein